MAKPAHTRVTFTGVVGTAAAPLERWAFGLNFPHDAIPGDATAIVADGVASDCATAYGTYINLGMGNDIELTGVKVSRIAATGLVERRGDGSLIQGEWAGDYEGLAAPKNYPLQTALCVSLVTSRAGATGKGRFFLPFPSYDLASDKRLTEADATDFLTNGVKPFVNELATILTYAPQVVSSKGYMSEVTGLRLGRVPDTMRSRREDLAEGYVVTPLG